jgi:hypothetical protein
MSPGRKFARDARAATWLACTVVGAATLAAPNLARALVVGLTATIGVAHGATDAAMLDRLRIGPGRVKISIAYGILAIAVYTIARRFPLAATRTLRAVSWAHFGSGDAAFARHCGSRGVEPIEAFVRGGLPLSIGGRDARSAWSFAAACAYAALGIVRGDAADALDVALPAAVLYAAPPRLGFGVYFATWHSPRHLALILERDPRGGSYLQRFVRFARESAPNVAVASAFGALAFAFDRSRAQREDLVTALILGITVPHQIAVWIVEYRSRVAAPDGG